MRNPREHIQALCERYNTIPFEIVCLLSDYSYAYGLARQTARTIEVNNAGEFKGATDAHGK